MKNMKDLLLQLENEANPEKQVEIIVCLTEQLLNNDIALCETYALKLLQLGEVNNLPIAYMQHYLAMGRISYRKANLNAAFDYYNLANDWASRLKHEVAQAAVLESKGTLLNKWGKHTQALESIFAALEIYLTNRVSNGIVGLCYNNIATTYDSLRNTDEAEKYYLKAIDTLTDSDKQQTINYVKANLGLLLLNKKDFEKALVYFNNSLDGFEAANQVQAQGLAYHYIAQCHLGLKNYGRALELYQKALKIFKNSRYYNELSVVYSGLGSLYQDIGGHMDAEVYFNKALEMRLMREFWNGACQSYLALYQLYISMDDLMMAKDMVTRGKALATKHDLTNWIKDFDGLINEFA